MIDQRICLYDGITLFVKDPFFREHLLKNKGRYRLKGKYDYDMKQLTNSFTGKFRNFDIYSAANSLGSGIALGGSLHNWKNGKFNYDTFYWEEFEQVYKEILAEFKFDPKQTDIWVLEAGLNIVLPPRLLYTASEIVQNIIFLKGDPTSSLEKKHRKRARSRNLERGESSVKIYDKGRQFQLEYELLRTEVRCKKRPLLTIGIKCFEDLLNYENNLIMRERLLKDFKSLLLFQPEALDNPLLCHDDKLFLLRFNNAKAWIDLRKGSDYKYQKYRKRYLGLIDQYCQINYQKEILEQMQK